MNKNPLAVIEDEKNEHDEKMQRMKDDMEDVFKRKVSEKQEKINRVEKEDTERVEKEMKHLEEDRLKLATKKELLYKEKQSWEDTHGFERIIILNRSTESLDGKKKKYGLPNNPFKFGRS